ncbi:MAG: ribonuclease R [Bradymonadia bacterium]|jgi:ribonuclease R
MTLMKNHGRTAEQALDALVEHFHLNIEQSADLLAEEQRVLASPGLDDDVHDQTSVPYVTIDNVDSRDLDQAIHVENSESGWRVRYALADASYYVRLGSPIWDRALAMGSSFYLPDRSIPMLPRSLSEGLISLNPGVDRRALVFDMHVDRSGTLTNATVSRCRVHSRAKLAYTGVQAWVDGDGPLTGDDALDVGVARSMHALRAVGECRMLLQEDRGVLPLHRSEADVRVVDGQWVATRRARNDVERWNEQISLLTNMAGAQLLMEFGWSSDAVQAVYRVHLPPLPQRLRRLEETLDALAQREGEQWRWRRGVEDLADYLTRLPAAPNRRAISVHRQVQYTFRASTFKARSGPHHALGVDGYSRMSSPMREAVGIFSHKELLEGLGLTRPGSQAIDEAARDAVIASANAAKKRQRALDKAVDLLVIEAALCRELQAPEAERPSHLGTLVGLSGGQLYVALDELAVDVKVYRTHVESDYGCDYTLDGDVALIPKEQGAGPTFTLGDSVSVRVRKWDEQRRRYALQIEHSANIENDKKSP